MKNLIESMMNIVMLSIISFILLTLILIEAPLIKNRNIYYQKYENALASGEANKYVKHEFKIKIPFIGGNISYTLDGYTR